jgi:hypothetical protein
MDAAGLEQVRRVLVVVMACHAVLCVLCSAVVFVVVAPRHGQVFFLRSVVKANSGQSEKSSEF